RDKVHDEPEQREDEERREDHRIIAIDDGLEAQKPKSVEREDGLDKEGAAEEGADECTREAGDDQEHGITEHVPIKHLPLGKALRARRHDVLLANLVEERVLRQEGHSREGTK